MKKIACLALLFAASAFSYDWVGTQWIVNAKIKEVRQNNDNVVLAVHSEGQADLGYFAIIGSADSKKGGLAILLAAASNGQRITFLVPGSRTIDPNVRDIQNVTAQVP